MITKQIVVKESKTLPVETWNQGVPEEVKMMQRMNNTSCPAVPKLIAYKRYMRVRKHRIYMEFCPYSDLAALGLNYKRYRYVSPHLQAPFNQANRSRTYLPEPFLWHTFKNLVTVAAAMKRGPNGTRWGYQIVHRDLKPANSKSFQSNLSDSI